MNNEATVKLTVTAPEEMRSTQSPSMSKFSPLRKMNNVSTKELMETMAQTFQSSTHLQTHKPAPLLLDSLYRSIWDMILLLFCFFYIFVQAHPYPFSGAIYFDSLISACYTLDILLRYFVKKDLVSDSKSRSHYPLGMFCLDVLAAFPFASIISYSISGSSALPSILCFIPYLRTIKVPRLLPLSERRLRNPTLISTQYVTFHYHYKPQILAIFWGALSIHLLTICWQLIGARSMFEDEGRPNYITSLYFILYTVTSVGFGDMCVKTDVQRLYSCLLFILGFTMNGILIGKLGLRFLKSDVDGERHSKMRDTVTVLQSFDIPKGLMGEILSFQHHRLQHDLSATSIRVINSLPLEIQEVVGLYVRLELVCSVPLFASAPAQCKVDLASALTSMVATPNKYIMKIDEEGDDMFFVAHGFAEVLNRNGSRIATLRKGSFFGDTAVLTKLKRTASVRTLTYCDLFRLHRDGFMDIIRKYPEFSEIIEREIRKRENSSQDDHFEVNSNSKSYRSQIFRRKSINSVLESHEALHTVIINGRKKSDASAFPYEPPVPVELRVFSDNLKAIVSALNGLKSQSHRLEAKVEHLYSNKMENYNDINTQSNIHANSLQKLAQYEDFKGNDSIQNHENQNDIGGGDSRTELSSNNYVSRTSSSIFNREKSTCSISFNPHIKHSNPLDSEFKLELTQLCIDSHGPPNVREGSANLTSGNSSPIHKPQAGSPLSKLHAGNSSPVYRSINNNNNT